MNLSPTSWIEAIEKYLGQTKGWLQMAQRIKVLEDRVAKLEGGTSSRQVCDHCGSTHLTRGGTRPSPGPFGALGLKEAEYRCADCGKTSYIDLPMP